MSKKIKRLHDFLEVIKTGEEIIYRGHASKEWDLVPSIGRDYIDKEKWTEEAIEIEREMLAEFKKQTARIIKIPPTSTIEWLALMQHHGMPTRLLDFSKNPLVALYFACSEKSWDEDGVVYSTKFTIKKNEVDGDLFTQQGNFTYFPHHISDRITSQSGLFICCAAPNKPLRGGLGNQVTKIMISKSSKSMILSDLRDIGIHPGSIFPGLEGTCKSLSDILEQKLFTHYYF